jgi:ribosomal protein S18 acetylase RimI-like enzyme
MNIEIKKAAPENVAQIIEMIREFAEFENLSHACEVTAERLREAMFGATANVEGLIALADNEPIAYALFYPNFASFRGQRGLYLEDIYIKPDFRQHKIGEKMLRELAQIADERGFERIDFVVLEWNTPAVKFYLKHGAEIDPDERHFRFIGTAFEKLAGKSA